ncbi:MAG TPA: flagellar biosynthesis protein FlhB [Candidatus Baltobacteraceae bacterium]|nr:flagellar biosynthesis protein FlhB [Candidatus Baltobacteraceae bacterium]
MARPEQTEKPTAKRRHEARERGQVPRSQELPGAVIFFAAVLLIYGLFSRAIAGVQSSVRGGFAHAGLHEDPNIHTAQSLLVRAAMPYVPLLLLLFGVAFVLGILANVGQFGFVFSPKPLQPSFSKVNPLTGFQRLFSKQIAVNLAKQILKLSAVVVILYQTIAQNLGFLAQVGQSTPDTFLAMLANLIFSIAWKFGLLLVVVGILDHVWMRYQYEDSLKMTKQEVKDEWRQSEGNPEAKAALKRRQREFARRRMMAAIPRATVVVTNPTHFAVALEWNELEMEAPVVTAKGADLVAKRIRQLAQEHGIPIMENPPLARTLYEKVELDQAIPPNLYAAVAQVIAFVFKLKRKTIA